ncbi:MAG: permease-like cell division protein FtsX [Oscillospiraceae bacterium]
MSNVHEAKFVSRQQALDEFVATQNDAELFAGIEADTLRDRFVVTLEDNSLITQTKQMLEQIDGVSEVVAHDEIANGFQTVQKDSEHCGDGHHRGALRRVDVHHLEHHQACHVLTQSGDRDHEDGRR